MESLTVSLSPEGVPVAFTVAGDGWRVTEEAVRWYERTPWWETASRMPREHGRIDVEVWQLQARQDTSRHRGNNTQQPLVTFVLVRDQNTGEWSVRSAAENPD
ncbi:hypothetical protein [Arthrobacter sp. ES1]|uniref:hypothetical protein n=1 Tax=Arthrobacter sp. ES1 TaxID=1897056 RepID=UPI001CFF9376|nr:hypothetical protein [Arthrobacter sp. ES1]MCB5280316.1 hypothetical protein [Arthrobacter sp. ES1]